MAKKGKDAKKKKGKPKTAPVCAFDIDSIGLAGLKSYVTRLEKELAQMRKDCAFYSVNKDRIMNFLESMRLVFASKKKTAVVNSFYIDDLIEQLRRFTETYNEKAITSDKEKARKKLEEKFNDFVQKNTARAGYLDEEYVLKKQISDIDKTLELNRYSYESSLIDAKELLRDAQEGLVSKHSEMRQRSIKQYVNDSLKNYQEFNEDKIKMLNSIFNADEHPCEVQKSFRNEMKNMQNFFYEISSNNNEVIRMLRRKLADLLTEEKKLNYSLREALLENKRLQDVRLPGFYDNNCIETPLRIPDGNTKSLQLEKKLQKLEFKNEVLKEQVVFAEANLKNLRDQFTSAVRIIYQRADYKAHILEEIIKRKLQLESTVLEQEKFKLNPTGAEIREKEDDLKDVINVFSISVEDSDTLFVPPVYNEFWDPSLRRKEFRRSI